MSKSLYFKAVLPDEFTYVDVTACQIRSQMRSVFGDYPLQLDTSHIIELNAMRKMWTEQGELFDTDPYGEILKLISLHPDGIILEEKS